MTVGANFSGLVAVMGSKISNWGGHGVWILGGAGYTISGSSIGRCGSNSPSTFDGIHVENTGVADINICDSHFDVDPTNSPYSKYPSLPQYAIFVGAGTSNYRITNNIFASAASAHYVNTGGPNNTPVAIGDANPTDTACPAYSGNIGPLADYWTTVTLPSAAASGFIRYAARPDRKLEFQFSLVNPSGIVTSPLSSPLNLAGALPGQVLPSGLRPAQDFRGAAPGIWSASPVTTVRFQVTTGGGVNILGIPSSGVVTEIDGHYIIPLT
jgi:hypothetical protein